MAAALHKTTAMIHWPRSLIARILLVEVGAIAVAAIALPMLLSSLLHKEVVRYQISTLTDQATAIARSMDPLSNPPTVRLGPKLANAYATPYDGRAYVVTDQGSRLVASSAYADLVPWRNAPRVETAKFFRSGAFIGISSPQTLGSRHLWIIVTQNEAGPGAILDDVVRDFVRRYDPLLVLALLMLPLVNSLLIGRVVLAVRSVSQRAQAIGPHNLNIRLEEEGLPLEVAPLAHATNELLVRLQVSFRHQSEFVANVAHELRTPLATHKVELEAVTDQELRARLSQSVDRMAHVVAQLQDLAGLEVIAEDHFETLNATDLARETIREHALSIVVAGDKVALDAPQTPVLVRVDRSLATLALSNLLANASRHTPAGTSIVVRVTTPGTIEVSDNGPGISSSTPEQSAQRHWRADHRRSDGAGLGLSIVKRIMEVHNGSLEITSEPGKGAKFFLHFRNARWEAPSD